MKRFSSHPDKKRRKIHVPDMLELLVSARDLFEQLSIGQLSATWRLRPAYPRLPVMILMMTDTHFGSAKTDTGRMIEHLNIVRSMPNFYVIHNGDHTDNFNSTIHASGMSENVIPPTLQGMVWGEILLELDKVGKLGVAGFGNHDDFTFDASQVDFYEAFFNTLKAPIFTQGGLLTIQYGKATYKLAMTHRYWGTSKLNPTNANKRYMEHEYPDADVIFLGHTHQSEGLHFERGGKDRIAVIGGTYKDRDSFARKRGIGGRAGSPGWVVCLYPNQRHMKLYKDVNDAHRDMLLYIETL